MFERFTEEARWVVVHAQEEARDLRSARIEPVHLLLALARDPGRGGQALRGSGLAPASARSAAVRAVLDADALAALGIDLDRVRAAAEDAFGPQALDRALPAPSGHLPFARESKRALEETLRAVVRRRVRRIDSGAVLVGLLAVADPVVDRVLRECGVDAAELRRRLDDQSDAA